MGSHARVFPRPEEVRAHEAGRRQRRSPGRPWGPGADRRRSGGEAALIWDWLALRQAYLRPKLHLLDLGGASPVPAADPAAAEERHWLEDPLAVRPVAAILRRAFDMAAASLLLLLLAPVLLAAMALVKLTSRGPALFRQRRIGYQCRTFSMLKLRTMVDGADRLEAELARGTGGVFLKLARDPRTTPLGRLLRKYSLDELPQLVNVLR
ncbi:MAG TPA: sugar transferase, partial [Vicinamibacteria bacterium]|nr:sugar transferase [Vicinamibacteria bacterium]